MQKVFEVVTVLTVLIFMGVVLWTVLHTAPSTDSVVSDIPLVTEPETPSAEAVVDFQFALEEAFRIEVGQPIEGYEPAMFMQIFPNLIPEDFDGVDALIGHYEFVDGQLVHELGDVDVIHSAAEAISEAGFETLLENVSGRLKLSAEASIPELIEELRAQDGPAAEEPIEPVACTMDAKICPDGSAVGRIAPDCEFAACPAEEPEPVVVEQTCAPESRLAEFCTAIYAPVCAKVQVECVTTPCDPVPETYSNSCAACINERVVSYTAGECAI